MTKPLHEILLALPSQIEIAAALHAVPDGPHRETVGRMATALDCLRGGGWEFVEREPRIERLKAGDPTFEELNSTHSRDQWCRVVKREIAMREAKP